RRRGTLPLCPQPDRVCAPQHDAGRSADVFLHRHFDHDGRLYDSVPNPGREIRRAITATTLRRSLRRLLPARPALDSPVHAVYAGGSASGSALTGDFSPIFALTDLVRPLDY